MNLPGMKNEESEALETEETEVTLAEVAELVQAMTGAVMRLADRVTNIQEFLSDMMIASKEPKKLETFLKEQNDKVEAMRADVEKRKKALEESSEESTEDSED